jgi:radical SAM protein with 4Fe4S-binding SPASM domain
MALPAAAARHLHQWYKAAERRECRLHYLFLELTRSCNLSCRHCGSDCTTTSPAASLSTPQWVALLDHIAASFSPLPTLVLTGGEPLLHPDFTEILALCHKRAISWGLVTNGYALTGPVMETLQRYGCCGITLSVDGLRENHDWLRNRAGAFDRTVRALDFIATSSIPLRDAVTCVNPRNINELDAIASLLIGHRMPAWRLFRIFPAGRARDNEELLLSKENTSLMIRWIRDNRPSLRNRGLAVQLSCEGWMPFAVDRTVRDQPFFCRAGINIASVLCDGTVTGCSNNDARFYQGNVLTEQFEQIWRTKFGSMRDRTWVRGTSCGSCRHVRECEGGSLHLWRGHADKPDFCYADCC